MAVRNFDVEFLWQPTENEFKLLNDVRKTDIENLKLTGPFKALKSYLRKKLDSSVNVKEVKTFVEFKSTHEDVKRIKIENALFYTDYLFLISCDLHMDGCKFDHNSVVNKFCCSEKFIEKLNSFQLWMKFNYSAHYELELKTIDAEIHLKAFSLGNIVGLNTFVEHFDSETSLNENGFKISNAKVKFLHDFQKLRVFFVVADSKAAIKERSACTHHTHKIELEYSGINKIIISGDDVYFYMTRFPLLYAVDQEEKFKNEEDYISFMDDLEIQGWYRVVDLFERSPLRFRKEFCMNTVLRLNIKGINHKHILNIMNHFKGIRVYFSPMTIIQSKEMKIAVNLDEFECFYAVQCLLTYSFEVHDQLVVKNQIKQFQEFIKEKSQENPKPLSTALYFIYSAITQGNTIPFFHSLKLLYDKLARSKQNSSSSELSDSRSHEHNLLFVKRAFFTPAHIRFVPPHPILRSRALRRCDSNFSLRVSLRDINLDNISYTLSQGFSSGKYCETFFNMLFKKPLMAGIEIGNRRYFYVGSSPSQLKGHGLWFYAKDDKGITASMLREMFANVYEITNAPKFMARLGQTFSQSIGSLKVPQEQTNNADPAEDVTRGVKKYISLSNLNYRGKNKPDKFLKVVDHEEGITEEPYTFSDGVGRMSEELAEKIYKKLDIEDLRPSAVQIRYAGCKGMLVVDPCLKEKQIYFRKSMRKFRSTDESLEILKYSKKRTTNLNRQMITILEQLGVPKEVFIQLQKKNIQSYIHGLYNNDAGYDFLNRNSQLRLDFTRMCESGISCTDDPLFKSMIYALIQKQIQMLKSKASIELPVNEGRSMFGVMDETFTLEYGQVFVQYTDWYTDEPKILEGTIVVTKSPCMHPGDVRKFTAVDVEALHHIRDCIVFPAKGDRPHPDEMAGSDLDGDEYHVMWSKDLIFSRENVEPMHFATPPFKKFELDRQVMPEDELDHLGRYIFKDKMGQFANAHLAFADFERGGIFSNRCKCLAEKYAIALDFAKSGRTVDRSDCDIAHRYPDFMEKFEGKRTYLSRKVLGILYRNCKYLELGLEGEPEIVEYKVDEDLIYGSWGKYLDSALAAYEVYCKKVDYYLSTYGFENEGQFLSGSILKPTAEYEQRHDLDNLKALLEYEVEWMFRDLEYSFFKEFGGKPKDGNFTEEMYNKASAWYAVAYTNEADFNKKFHFFGFPWAVDEVLTSLKCRNVMKRPAKKSRVRKSYLEEIIDKSIIKHFSSEELRSVPDNFDDNSAVKQCCVEVADLAAETLNLWRGTFKKDYNISDEREFRKCIDTAFESVTHDFWNCDDRYINYLRKTNELRKAISPCHQVIQTLQKLHSMTLNQSVDVNQNNVFSSVKHELGLFSWTTLVKLACSNNPQHLGLPDSSGAFTSQKISQNNTVSCVTLPLFDDESDENCTFSQNLLGNTDIVLAHIKRVTGVKSVSARYVKQRSGKQCVRFTTHGPRYCLEKLRDGMLTGLFFVDYEDAGP